MIGDSVDRGDVLLHREPALADHFGDHPARQEFVGIRDRIVESSPFASGFKRQSRSAGFSRTNGFVRFSTPIVVAGP